MTREEHLQRIVDKCLELLAIAEKRTPRKWNCPNTRTEVFMSDSRPVAMCWGPDASAHGNAAFIASCAGPAEAGWKATIAAIDALVSNAGYWSGRPNCTNKSQDALDAIIAAWPEELL